MLPKVNTPITFLSQKDEKLLNIKEVAKIVGFNVDWIYKKIAKGEFPKPIKIGRSSRWLYTEIMQWLNETANQSTRL